ncbi:MAG TPA: hypothetical protein VHP81_10465, partial [Lachnospiraceae bacterium]|nr:hypothetical protein [Lachnospiraceae bacterium]
MKNFILFELKKIIGNKRNIAVIAILFLLILVFVSSNDDKYQEEKESTIKNAKFLADWYEKSERSYTEKYEEQKLYIYKLFGDISKVRADYFSGKAKFLENGDRKSELDSEIAYCEAQIEYFIRGYLYEGGSMTDPII